MKHWLPPAVFLVACLAAAPSPAQEQTGLNNTRGTADDIDADKSPVIVNPDRVGGQPTEDRKDFRSELEAFVQIPGAWASDEAACNQESNGQGIYLTDTIVRSEDATCSIRDVETMDDTAKIFANCTIGGDRRERTFTLRKTGEDTLTITASPEGPQSTTSLARCPNQQ